MPRYVIQHTYTRKYWAAGAYTDNILQATAFENDERSFVKLDPYEKWVKL